MADKNVSRVIEECVVLKLVIRTKVVWIGCRDNCKMWIRRYSEEYRPACGGVVLLQYPLKSHC